MLRLAEAGVFRSFAATTVRAEVDAHLLRVAVDVGAPPHRVAEVFQRRYLPLIHWVDVSDLELIDPRIAAVAHADDDDVPSARLAVLLGVRALSEDRAPCGAPSWGPAGRGLIWFAACAM